MRRVGIVALTLLAFASSGFASDDGPPHLSRAELASLAEGRRASITSLYVDFTARQAPPPEDSRAKYIQTIHRSMLIDAVGGRFQMRRSLAMSDGTPPAPAVFAFDGDAEQTLLENELSAVIDSERRIDSLSEANILGIAMLNPPRRGAMGIDDGSLESLLQFARIDDEIELIDGHPCAVVHAEFDGVEFATVWLDIERDLLPLRCVGYGHDGGVNGVVEVDSAKEFAGPSGERAWLPVTWHTDALIQGGHYRIDYEADVDSIELNVPVANESFQVQFPPGTIVNDVVEGSMYLMGNAGERIYFDPVEPRRPPTFIEELREDSLAAARQKSESHLAQSKSVDAAAQAPKPPESARAAARKEGARDTSIAGKAPTSRASRPERAEPKPNVRDSSTLTQTTPPDELPKVISLPSKHSGKNAAVEIGVLSLLLVVILLVFHQLRKG